MSVAPEAGDVVVLVSGGPPMTVEKYDPSVEHSVHCVWFNPDTKAMAHHAFIAATLNPVSDQSSDTPPAPPPPTGDLS